MTTDRRRLAADARRATDTGEIRDILQRNYARGKAAGRAEMRTEVANHDSRTTLLNCSADFLERAEARASAIPNSDRTTAAFREAASILRDAARLGEAEMNGDGEVEAEKATPKKAAKRAKKASSKRG